MAEQGCLQPRGLTCLLVRRLQTAAVWSVVPLEALLGASLPQSLCSCCWQLEPFWEEQLRSWVESVEEGKWEESQSDFKESWRKPCNQRSDWDGTYIYTLEASAFNQCLIYLQKASLIKKQVVVFFFLWPHPSGGENTEKSMNARLYVCISLACTPPDLGNQGLIPQDLLRPIMWNCSHYETKHPFSSSSFLCFCAIHTGGSDQGKYMLAYAVLSKNTKKTLWSPRHLHNGSVTKSKLPHVSFCFVNSWGNMKLLWAVSPHKLFSAIVTLQRLADSQLW